MARRRHYKRPKKPHSRSGIWATAIAVFSLIICVFVTSQAVTEKAVLPDWIGALSLLAMVENFFGLFLAFREIRDEEKALLFRVTGLAGTLFMSVTWVGYYLLGLILI